MSRDDWCTPRWLTDLIGPVDLDPCSNERSTVQANRAYSLADGRDGLGILSVELGPSPETVRTFVNPPYSRGQVAKWVRAYKHTACIFLLRWDPSTAWFRELMDRVHYVWFPHQRINFEPPPGVSASSNPFPHALYIGYEADPAWLARLIGQGTLLK